MSCSPPAARSRSRTSASSIRRRWSSSVSDLRVIFSAAISERLATSRADLAERLLRRLLDLARRLLEAALAVLLDLGAHALALRVGDLAGLGEDALGLALRLADQPAVLLEQAARLLAGAVGLLDRLRGCGRAARRSASGSGRTRSASARRSVIANAMIVQIISPGMTSTSGFVASSIEPCIPRPGRSRAGRRGSRRRRRPR